MDLALRGKKMDMAEDGTYRSQKSSSLKHYSFDGGFELLAWFDCDLKDAMKAMKGELTGPYSLESAPFGIGKPSRRCCTRHCSKTDQNGHHGQIISFGITAQCAEHSYHQKAQLRRT